MNLSRSIVAWIAVFLFVTEMPTFAQAKKNVGAAKTKADPRVTGGGITLARIAADSPVLFVSSNGCKSGRSSSTNKTEQLMEEPSVTEFFQRFIEQVKVTVEKKSPENGENFSKGIALVEALVRHPMAIQLIDFTIANPPEINLEVVIDLESDAARVREIIEELIKLMPTPPMEQEIEGVKFFSPPFPEGEKIVTPRWGWHDSTLIFTLGSKTTASTVQKVKATGTGTAWLDATLRELAVPRPTTVFQLDVGKILKTVDPLLTDPNTTDAKVKSALDASGVLGIKRISVVTGMDETGTVEKLAIENDGAPRGLLTLFSDKPITVNDLKGIPAKVAQATVARFDLGKLVEEILNIADSVEPNVRDQYESASKMGEGLLGFSLKDDLLKSFGDVWMSYVSGGEPLAIGVPNMVLAASVRDQKKLTKVQTGLVAFANQQLNMMGPQAPVTISEYTTRGAKGYRVQVNNPLAPINIVWVITKDQFVIGTNPQLVSAHLIALANSSGLNASDDIKAAFKRNPKSTMISYRDPKPEIQQLYTLLDSLLPMGLAKLKEDEGIDFTVPPLPPISDIEKYLAPTIMTAGRDANSWRVENRGVVPSITTTAGVSAVGMALLLPAVQQGRLAARRTQAKNNLKQIGLCMFNYESTYREFPNRNILGVDGKPKLSWRVAILPLLGKQELYAQFHLDEAWDSPHNKELISKMPANYATPGENATKGLTQYVVLNCPGSVFEGPQGTKLAEISDGTSNTILAVEVRTDQAVTWTAPDDLEFDVKDPLKGLKSAQTGGFHVLLCDGAVRFIQDNIDTEILKALMTKAGKEPIGDY